MPDTHINQKNDLNGIIDLVQAATNKETNPEYDFFLQGDLGRLAEQKSQLIIWGFDVQQNDCYPCLKKSDAKRALELILNFRISGWWQYENNYIELGICTKKEFDYNLESWIIETDPTWPM